MSIAMFGSAGMELIRYEGGNAGIEQYVGKITRARYAFGGARPEGWVDGRDVEWFLSLKDNGRPLFIRVDAEQAVQDPDPQGSGQSQPAGDEKPKEDEGEAAEPPIDPANAGNAQPPDYAKMKVAEIKALQLDRAGWQAVYDAEEAGQGRATVLEFVKDQLEHDQSA